MKTLAMFGFLSSIALGWTHVGNNIRGWNQSPVTFYVNYSNCPLSQAEMNEIIDVAINTWNGITDSNLEVKRAETSLSINAFLNGTATEVPVILCDPNFATQIGSPEVYVVPAATFLTRTDSNGNLNYSGILLNAQNGVDANIGNLSRGQVELTLAHEMGHALGLGHSSQPEALMYYSLGTKEQPVMTEDDIDGIVHIYPRNELSGGVLGCAAVKSEPLSPHSATSWKTLIPMMLLLILGWAIGRVAILRASEPSALQT